MPAIPIDQVHAEAAARVKALNEAAALRPHPWPEEVQAFLGQGQPVAPTATLDATAPTLNTTTGTTTGGTTADTGASGTT